MIKLSHPITSINGFKIGNKVRLKDGDGRPHVIKSFSIDGMKEFFFEVQFEDGTETMLNNIAPLTTNLDMAAEEYAENILAGGEDMFDAISDGFIAGAHWQEEQMMKEKYKIADSILRECGPDAKRENKTHKGCDFVFDLRQIISRHWYSDIYGDYVENEAQMADEISELCKEQMMKDAVEGVAEELYNDGESQCTVGVGTYFKPGEEVYVIKKEDEK